MPTLRELLDDPTAPNIEVTGVTDRLEEVGPGFLFFAIQGLKHDGHVLAKEALLKGAVTVVCEKDIAQDVPALRVASTREAYARACVRWFSNPSSKLKVIATTGTSGKTTTTYLIQSLMNAAGFRTALLSTVENNTLKRTVSSSLTTPGPKETQSLLAEALEAGAQSVVLEASSHAIHQKRILATEFDSLVFTNLSSEHLDYHKNLEDYFQAKAELFRSYLGDSLKKKRVNVTLPCGDPFGVRLIEEIRNQKLHRVQLTLYGEGSEKMACDGEYFVELQSEAYSMRSTLLTLRYGQKSGVFDSVNIESSLIGSFNAQNMMASIGAVLPWILESEVIKKGIRELKAVPGRMQKITAAKDRHIFIDYAHKPDALEKVLKVLKEVEPDRRRITVFGCGGDRDAFKRPKMGEIAARLSDDVWITSDNPRTEDPNKIIEAIESGIPKADRKRVHIEPDRRKAIESAIAGAPPHSVVLIAGKGHEDYQIVGDLKSPFSDEKVAMSAAARLDSQN